MSDALGIVRRWVESVNARDFAAFDELFSPGYVNHHRPYAQDDGVEGLKAFFVAMCDAIDGLRYGIETLAEHDGLVRLRVVGHGRLVAPFAGVDAVGRDVAVSVTHLYRVSDGVITDRWGDPADPFVVSVTGSAA